MAKDNMFGFTNDQAEYDAAVAFREAAKADGWTCVPTYGDSEPVERAARLMRDGWVISILAREKVGKWKYEANVHAWGPDGMSIRTPRVYDFQVMQAELRTCKACGATDVPTHRYSFAGRCCEQCLPEMRRQHEGPGWDR